MRRMLFVRGAGRPGRREGVIRSPGLLGGSAPAESLACWVPGRKPTDSPPQTGAATEGDVFASETAMCRHKQRHLRDLQS